MRTIATVAMLMTLLACGSGDTSGDDTFVPSAGARPAARSGPVPAVAAEYAAELNVDLESMTVTPTGLRYKDLVVGDGTAAAPGHSVVTRYDGWLSDGRRFDAGVYPPPEGGTLILGTGDVIAGWDQGIAGMRVGGKRQLVIPPELGYGASGSRGVIPGGATLVFEVELLATGN